ncbi:hypothetical protein AQUCO_00700502v1 [Aquilegia coerulea]|uniref:Uncharacterized protein n=1 Tax=Aquilegia coerulea TaxID=218851 RepID=A0A2G5EK98_AQUCA|nr:hypothetical protein AQUCO_00700502v1 [Aquilegia coerulea]
MVHKTIVPKIPQNYISRLIYVSTIPPQDKLCTIWIYITMHKTTQCQSKTSHGEIICQQPLIVYPCVFKISIRVDHMPAASLDPISLGQILANSPRSILAYSVPYIIH